LDEPGRVSLPTDDTPSAFRSRASGVAHIFQAGVTPRPGPRGVVFPNLVSLSRAKILTSMEIGERVRVRPARH
jgi:hypothetical protein